MARILQHCAPVTTLERKLNAYGPQARPKVLEHLVEIPKLRVGGPLSAERRIEPPARAPVSSKHDILVSRELLKFLKCLLGRFAFDHHNAGAVVTCVVGLVVMLGHSPVA